ncbi:hypothetical protein B9Z55_003236 [Caenorhabditis nigoni]|uniref:Uncharacterized protein n=1 Tax=Caenorhabditis nigoni TaxID=1611254 RepID=A0A2G5VP92_9PELO|nr:hypothetical protein B9Z55_003236 [Caenorhabditis nigoni]
MKSLLILFVVGFVVVNASLSSLNTFEKGQAHADQKWLQSMMSKPRATHDSHGKRILYMDGQEDFFYGWVFDDEKFSSEELSHEECKLKTLSFSTVSMKQADCEDLKCPQLEGKSSGA